MTKQISSAIKVSTIAAVLFLGFSYAYAWTGPTASPPNNNTPAPINVSATAQTKNGQLIVNDLTARNGMVAQDLTGVGYSAFFYGNIMANSYVTVGAGGTGGIRSWNGNFPDGPGDYHLQMQPDGNLVIYNGSGTACWSARYGGTGNCSGTIWPVVGFPTGGPSSRELKTNILPLANSLAKVTKLQGVSFNFKDEKYGAGPQIGVIAEDVEKVFPETITDINGIKGVQYGLLVAPLIEAVKEQQKTIDSLEQRLSALEAK